MGWRSPILHSDLLAWSGLHPTAKPWPQPEGARTPTTPARPAWKNPEASNCFQRELPSQAPAAQESSAALSPGSSHLLSSGIWKLSALRINCANGSQGMNSICRRTNIEGVLHCFSWSLASAGPGSKAPGCPALQQTFEEGIFERLLDAGVTKKATRSQLSK